MGLQREKVQKIQKVVLALKQVLEQALNKTVLEEALVKLQELEALLQVLEEAKKEAQEE